MDRSTVGPITNHDYVNPLNDNPYNPIYQINLYFHKRNVIFKPN